MKNLFLIICLIVFASLHAEKQAPTAKPALPALKSEVNCLMAKSQWEQATTPLQKIVRYYPTAEEAVIGQYYLGLCYYNLRDFDLANKAFSSFLERDSSGAHFEEVIGYKFFIAEAFRNGECSHLFGARKLPKWLSADNEAIEIYDEIIAVMPGQELAVRSLWGKGLLLVRAGQYKEGREAFQTLISAFPKNPLAIESYLQIATSYLKESQKEPNNSDLLSLAAINVKKFKQSFPGESRVALAEKMYCQMQEFFAASIYEVAEFYEKGLSTTGSFDLLSLHIKRISNNILWKMCTRSRRSYQLFLNFFLLGMITLLVAGCQYQSSLVRGESPKRVLSIPYAKGDDRGIFTAILYEKNG